MRPTLYWNSKLIQPERKRKPQWNWVETPLTNTVVLRFIHLITHSASIYGILMPVLNVKNMRINKINMVSVLTELRV